MAVGPAIPVWSSFPRNCSCQMMGGSTAKYLCGCCRTLQGGNPFDMGKMMESLKKAQELVQVETKRMQEELDE